MFRPSWIAFLAAPLLMVGCGLDPTPTGVDMVQAMQRTAPAHLARITFGYPNLLKVAQLKNESRKPITSYRIGWANVHRDGIELHRGDMTSVPGGIEPGHMHDVSDQMIALDERAQSVVFFVAEVSFADGSNWKIDIPNIAHEAGLTFFLFSLWK
jgi:hypothetical protein